MKDKGDVIIERAWLDYQSEGNPDQADPRDVFYSGFRRGAILAAIPEPGEDEIS